MNELHSTDAVGGLRVVNDRERSRYELFLQGDLVGFVNYEMTDGYLVLVHAEVRSDQRGHGLGTELATGVLEDLDRRGLPTRTSCSFVARFLGSGPIDAGCGRRSELSNIIDAPASGEGRSRVA